MASTGEAFGCSCLEEDQAARKQNSLPEIRQSERPENQAPPVGDDGSVWDFDAPDGLQAAPSQLDVLVELEGGEAQDGIGVRRVSASSLMSQKSQACISLGGGASRRMSNGMSGRGRSKMSAQGSSQWEEDMDDLEMKGMLRKVLGGIQQISQQQGRMEDLLVLQAREARAGGSARRAGPRHSTSMTSMASAGCMVGSSPVRNVSAAALTASPTLALGDGGAMMMADRTSNTAAIFGSYDEEEDMGHESSAQWPESVLPRHPPPMELAAEDEKLVQAITKMGITGKGLAFTRQHSGEKSHRCWKLPVLHPNSSKILLFDFIGCLVLLHDICVTPYVLAWRADVEGPLLATAFASFAFWISDSLMGFCMAYYSEGELRQTQPEVAWHYFRRQFPIDVCLILADALSLFVDTLIQVGSSLVADGGIRTFRLFKLTRLVKLARAARVARLIDKMWVSDTDAPTSSSAFVAALVAKILIVTIISNHILACVWFWQGAYGVSDTETNWLVESDLLSASRIYQYSTALHWSVAQMTLGASDANPSNSYERFLNIIFLLNGLVFGSTTVSYVSAAIVDYIMLKRDATTRLLECRRFLRQYGAPQKLSAQVVKQVAKRLSEEVPLKEEKVAALSLLAPTLRHKLHYATRIPHLERHALFTIWTEVEARSLEALSEMAVTHKFMSREDDLFQAGQICDQAWFLIRGRLKYHQQPGFGQMEKEVNTIVHVNSWIAEAALWSFWTNVGSIEANEKSCHLLALSAEGLQQTLVEFPTIQVLTRQYAKNFHSCVTSAGPPHSKWPNDLQIPFTEDTAMLLSQHVGMGLLKRALAHGRLELSEADEAYVVKELMAGKCTIQFAEDGNQLERVVYLTNVLLRWQDLDSAGVKSVRSLATSSRNSREFFSGHSILYQLAAVDEKGKKKPALHMPGTKRLTGESPALALQRILDADLRPFAGCLAIEDSQRKVSVKDSTQSVKMRTKTVKTIYRASLRQWPVEIQSMKVPFPDLEGLEELCIEGHNLLILPQDKQVGIYSFLQPEQYDIIDSKENADVVKQWVTNLPIEEVLATVARTAVGA